MLIVPLEKQRQDRDNLRQQPVHLLLELVFCLAHAPVAHGLVLGGIGSHLDAVDRHMSQLHKPRLLAKDKDLGEQRAERLQVAFAEVRDAVVIGMLVARKRAKRHFFVGGALDLSRRRLAHAVRVHEQLDLHGREITTTTPIVAALVDRVNDTQIELLDQVVDEQRQMSFGQPVAHVGGQQQPLIDAVWQEVRGHAPLGKFHRAVVHARRSRVAPFVHPPTVGELEGNGRAPLERDSSRRRPVGPFAKGKSPTSS
jgi:hypothetical protein